MNVFSRKALACGLSAVIALSGVPAVALADEADGAASEGGMAAQAAGEASGEASGPGDATSTAQPSELKENSWRYQDGQLIPEEEGSASARSGEAWSLSEYGYLNSLGSVIPGALNKGIDVSEHNGWIDWEAAVADGVDFAIIRCGYGSDYTFQDDAWWEYNVSECERLGIPYGVYLYSYAYNTSMARSEAEHALRLLAGHHPTLPVFYDMEDGSTFVDNADGSINLEASRANFGDMAFIFCEAMEDAGYWAGVYANLNWFENYLTDSRFELYMRWVAQYNYRCDWGGPKVLWQSTSSGHVDGVSGNVDVNFDYFGFCYPDDVGAYDWYVQDGHYFYVSKFGYLDGYDNGLWGPNDQLTRAQVAMVLWRAAGQPWADAEDFSDVDYGAWYADCIEWARQTGVIAGYGDTNLFGPDDPVTREQLAVMLARYAQQYVGTWADDAVLRSKADAYAVSDWAWGSMAWAVNCGILTGVDQADGSQMLYPQGYATRAEASKMFTVLLRDVL